LSFLNRQNPFYPHPTKGGKLKMSIAIRRNVRRAGAALMAAVVAAALCLNAAMPAHADDKQKELENKKNELQSELDQIRQQLKDVASDKAEAEQQKQLLVQEKNTIKGQINALNDQIDDISAQIVEKEQQITDKQAEIDQKQAEYDDRWAKYKEQVVSMQMLDQGGGIALLSTAENIYQLLTFDQVLQVARGGQFDSLAHLTYPLRYILAQPGLRVELSKYREKIDAVLLELIQQKKALEVNTSGLRQQIGDTLPDAGIVRRFYELGGTYVTLGSDAHRWADVSAGIEEAMSMIYKTGFRHYTIYSKREPRLVPIE